MICAICKSKFYTKRKLLELFNTEYEYICNKCYKNYPLELNFETIELEKYNCFIISMFKKNYHINYNAFFREYSKIAEAYMFKEGFKFMLINTLRLDDETFEYLDIISKNNKSNLIILTFYITY